MLRRDFTKSNKEYFKSNKKVLISIAVFLLVGILIFAIFGLNGNFEIIGYNEFTVNVNEKIADDINKYHSEIGNIIDSYDARFDNVRITGEGDNTQFVVRYLRDLKEKDVLEINKLVADELGVDQASISAHVHVKPIVKNSNYLYTALAILLLTVIVTIFAYVRYNGASALAIIIANLLGTMAFLSISALLRLSVGMSYLALLVILNMLIDYCAINLFETMHKSSWLMSGDYATAIGTAIKKSKFRMIALTVGVMAVGIMMVLFAPSAIKYLSLNLLFMAVVLLAVALYVIPFVWSVFITMCRKRNYKIKVSSSQITK